MSEGSKMLLQAIGITLIITIVVGLFAFILLIGIRPGTFGLRLRNECVREEKVTTCLEKQYKPTECMAHICLKCNVYCNR